MKSIKLIGTARHKLGKDNVTFAIDDRAYCYELDSGFIDKIEQVAEHKPGFALCIAKLHGTLIRK